MGVDERKDATRGTGRSGGVRFGDPCRPELEKLKKMLQWVDDDGSRILNQGLGLSAAHVAPFCAGDPWS